LPEGVDGGILARMRRAGPPVAAALALAALAGSAAAGRSSYFSPKNRLITPAALAGVTPRSSWAAVQRAWGGRASSGPGQSASWGRSVAVWGSPGIFSQTVAWAGWGGGVGQRPIRFAVDLEAAEGLGYALRTRRGDRVGTTARIFRRHWPGAERMPSDPEWTYYFVPSTHRGWKLVFLFRAGRLKHVELARNDFVNACLRKTCPRGFPPR
jgi:hypothetical protein